jgi:ribosomal protein S18 acetylase RimI-like enzyme
MTYGWARRSATMTEPVSYRVLVCARLQPSLAAAVEVLDEESLTDLALGDDQVVEFQDRFCSGDDIYGYALALDGPTAIGMVVTYRRQLNGPTGPYWLGGIGSVYVLRSCRRQGIAARLMAAAMEGLHQVPCDVAYLCTNLDDPAMHRLYRPHGFVPLSRPHTYVGLSGQRYFDNDAMLAPIGSPALFETLFRQTAPLDIGRGNW